LLLPFYSSSGFLLHQPITVKTARQTGDLD
jgi:hypothetical protein